MGLSGWTRNLDDGRVEVLAWGGKRQLDRLEVELKIGPPRAEVKAIAQEPSAPDQKTDGFHIR